MLLGVSKGILVLAYLPFTAPTSSPSFMNWSSIKLRTLDVFLYNCSSISSTLCQGLMKSNLCLTAYLPQSGLPLMSRARLVLAAALAVSSAPFPTNLVAPLRIAEVAFAALVVPQLNPKPTASLETLPPTTPSPLAPLTNLPMPIPGRNALPASPANCATGSGAPTFLAISPISVGAYPVILLTVVLAISIGLNCPRCMATIGAVATPSILWNPAPRSLRARAGCLTIICLILPGSLRLGFCIGSYIASSATDFQRLGLSSAILADSRVIGL